MSDDTPLRRNLERLTALRADDADAGGRLAGSQREGFAGRPRPVVHAAPDRGYALERVMAMDGLRG